MEADVTVNAVTDWGRVFDFSNGAGQDNVLLGLDQGGKWNAHVYHGTTRQAGILDPVASPLGVEMSMVLVYTRTGPTTGPAVLYIDGVERVSGDSGLPLMVTRTNNLVKSSPWPQDTPLDGTVKNFKFYACDATNAPDTDAPPTDAPATDAPPTDAPATDAPDTDAPPTDAPATDAPDTDAPPTDAPATDAPATDAPDTDAPSTDAPDTDAPQTDAPATDAPDTSAPPTDAPPTDAPATDAPATDAPATDAPDTDAPATDAPPTDAPATDAPDTDAPPTDAPATDAPATDAPDTDAPPTDAPATDAPATDAPDTDAPPTDAPDTDAPPTDAPATDAPATDAPVTDAPATNAPDTMAPLTPAPLTTAPVTSAPTTVPTASPTPAPTAVETTAPRFRDTPTSGLKAESKETIEVSSTVASSAAVAGGAAGNAGKLAVLNSFGCEMDDVDLGDETLDWEFHPLMFAMGSAHGKYKVAAMVMNPLLIMVVGMIAVGVSLATQHTLHYAKERALGLARFPGVLYVPYLFLLQGTSLVSTQVVFDASRYSAGVVVMAAAVLGVCLVSPALLYFTVLRHVERNAELFPDPAITGNPMTGEQGARAHSKLYKFAFGLDIWVSRESGHFAERYGICFENLRPGCLWYIVSELLCILCLSLLSGWKPTTKTACDTRNFSIAVMLTAFFLAAAIKRPFIAPLDNLVAIIMGFSMAMAVILMSIAITTETQKDAAIYTISMWCLLVSALLIMVKCVWDFVMYSADVCMSRRTGARELARDMYSNKKHLSEMDILQVSMSGVTTPVSSFTHDAVAQPSSVLYDFDLGATAGAPTLRKISTLEVPLRSTEAFSSTTGRADDASGHEDTGDKLSATCTVTRARHIFI